MRVSNRRSGWLQAIILFILLTLPLTACSPSAPAPTSAPTGAAAETTAPEVETSAPSLDTFTPPSETSAVPAAATPTLKVYKLAGAKTTDSGLQYLEEVAGKGEPPKKGDLVTMNYAASLTDGTELVNTFKQGKPVTSIWGTKRLLPGWEEGIGLMKVGTKAKMVLPPSLAFGNQGSGSIPPNSQIILEVELLKSETAPTPADVAADKLTKTKSGLQYYDLTVGKGQEAAKNSSVSTAFTIWYKTDSGYTYVDSSIYGKPVDFVIGRLDYVFAGWDEGVTGMKVGGKRLLVIQPDLGMGSQASSIIPANSTLVMEVELLKLTEPRLPSKVDDKDFTTTSTGLKYYDLTPGTGATPKKGQTVVVNYTGWLTDGTQFDSSLDRGQPFSFVLGSGNVIAGWDEGVATMKVGGKRQLVIPASLAYKDQGAGTLIKPGATLIFEVELLEIK